MTGLLITAIAAPALHAEVVAAIGAPATVTATGEVLRARVAHATPTRADAIALRRQIAAALGGRPIDLAVRVGWAPPSIGLVVMDMDSTAITIEVIDELARVHGVGPEVAAITERAMRGELDFTASLRARVGKLAGLSAVALDELAARLPLSPGLAALVDAARAQGARIAIASGGFTFAADALARRLGLDHVEANRLAIVDGVVTGEVDGPIVTAARKAAVVDELAARYQVDRAATVAIGDGANDALMLARAGFGVAYHGKPTLAAAADATIDHGGLERALVLAQ